MNTVRVTVLLLVAAGLGIASASGKQSSRLSEQLDFSAEEPGVKKPVAIPDQVLDMLRRDKTVAGALEDEGIEPTHLPRSWFSASAIHLSKSKTEDLIVVGEPPVSGGSVALFWIFLGSADGYRMVLSAAAAHGLVAKNSYYKGYRTIELIQMNASESSRVLCRFDGKQFTQYRVISAPNR